VKVPAVKDKVAKVTDRIDVLITSASPPDLVLNRHCAECEFQTRCRQKAVEKDDLSLLSSMTERERTDFNSKGIFTVTQLSFTFHPRRRPKGLRDKRERHHHALKGLAIREKKLHIVGSPEFKIDGTPVYLDVEGLTDQVFYYLVGIRTKAGDSVVQHSLWADEPSDEGHICRTFLSKLMDIENLILIHYGSFETVFLKRMCKRHGGPPNGSVAAKALESPLNLLSVIFGQIYFPTYSNGLKEIAGWLGFRWSDRDSSGAQSILWRNDRPGRSEAPPSLALEKAAFTRSHEVEFYSDDAAFVVGFTRFIEAALEAGSAVIAVATEPHRKSLLQRLQEQGVDTIAAIEQGRYVSVDVDDTLSAFMVNDLPDPMRFFGVAGDLFTTAARATVGGRVAICGECGSILWAQGNADAAIQVEQLGNQLARRYDMDILCGFSLTHFSRKEDKQIFQKICRVR
jgi:hypothetical protein